MRLKTFSAPTMSEAMGYVRAHMGDDAIIVSTQKGSDGLSCRITAALEDHAADGFVPAFEPDPPMDAATQVAFLRQVLIAHGLPPHMLKILLSALDSSGAPSDPALALAAAIDARLRFHPIDLMQTSQPIILAGAPGAGKTITAAKIAAQAKFAGKSICVVTTDAKRAGGVEQLQAFTRILDIELIVVATTADLAGHAETIRNADVTIIDTAGVSPFDDDEMSNVEAIADAVGGETILVLPAGGDAMETADTAAAFAAIGTRRMIVTRLDMTRRLGGILSAGLGGRLAVANVSINPQVADGLGRLNPVSLARLIVPEDDTPAINPKTKVAQ